MTTKRVPIDCCSCCARTVTAYVDGEYQQTAWHHNYFTTSGHHVRFCLDCVLEQFEIYERHDITFVCIP